MIPEITTERLRLRALRRDDFVAYAACLMGERGKYLGGYPISRNEAWSSFVGDAGSWLISGYGYWAIELDGAFMGFTGLAERPIWPERELGWILAEAAEGRGIAFEAASAVQRYARALGWATLVSYIDADNTRSIRLAERLGAVRDDAAARPDPEDVVYRHWGSA